MEFCCFFMNYVMKNDMVHKGRGVVRRGLYNGNYGEVNSDTET